MKTDQSPKPHFEKTVHEFGSVLAGEVVQFDFEFVNSGEGTLEILKITPSCGCTTAGEFEKVIPPGGKGRIPVKVDTKKLSGPVSKSVDVGTNAPGAEATVTLSMKGEVRPLLLIEPAKLEFGAMQYVSLRGKSVEKSFTVTAKIDRPLTISNPRSSNPNFSATVKPVEAGKKYEVTVTLGPNSRPGSNGAYIYVETNYPEFPELRIPAAVFANAPLDVMPSQLVLTSNRKATVTRAFYVRNNLVAPVQVSSLRASDPKLKVSLEEVTRGMAWKIRLEAPADYTAPEKGDTISLNTSHPDVPELVIDVFERKPDAKATAQIGKGKKE
ncbi:MAG TPA: DUF1573 domain-containing protein [Phycisphaerae bacterium]|nr:DUF1573 domain-containing protein [Phycisphaerae bacterium]